MANPPSIAFILSNDRVFRKHLTPRTQEEIGRLTSLRQRDILGGFGFPSTEAAARILRHVPPGFCTRRCLLRLRVLLRSGHATRKLSFLPVVNGYAAEILCDPKLRRYCHSKLLLACSRFEEPQPRNPVYFLRRVLGAAEIFEEIPRFKAITSFSHLAGLGTELEEYRHHLCPAEDSHFTEPPLPGIDGVVEPLTCAKDLVDESVTMGHCVADFISQISEGRNLYAYRILENTELGLDRSTVMLGVDGCGQYGIQELSGRNNQPVSNGTSDFIDKWVTDRGGCATIRLRSALDPYRQLWLWDKQTEVCD